MSVSKKFLIFEHTGFILYSLYNYLVTVVDIFVTIYNYRAHNYFITIVMKFRNYFPSSTNHSQEAREASFQIRLQRRPMPQFISNSDIDAVCAYTFAPHSFQACACLQVRARRKKGRFNILWRRGVHYGQAAILSAQFVPNGTNCAPI